MPTFEKPALPVQDETTFADVKGAIESAFAPAEAGRFLGKLSGARLRARDFEGVLGRGLLGTGAQVGYARLLDGDRGQIRELYLARVEQVAPELRAKYLKVYAYY